MITEKWNLVGAHSEYLQFPRDTEYSVEKIHQRSLLASNAPEMYNLLQRWVAYAEATSDDSGEFEDTRALLLKIKIPLLDQP